MTDAPKLPPTPTGPWRLPRRDLTTVSPEFFLRVLVEELKAHRHSLDFIIAGFDDVLKRWDSEEAP